MIHARQIKAARALLDWSQDELAANTNLCVATIRNLESGDMSPRNATNSIITQVLTDAGIEFTYGDGVRRRNDEIKIYQGPHSCDVFFDEVLRCVKENSGAIVSVFKSSLAMVQCCSIKRGDFGRLEELSKSVVINCVLPNLSNAMSLPRAVQFRIAAPHFIGPVSYFIYGNNHAIVIEEPNATFRFVVFSSYKTSQDYKKHFARLWDASSPTYVELRARDEDVVKNAICNDVFR